MPLIIDYYFFTVAPAECQYHKDGECQYHKDGECQYHKDGECQYHKDGECQYHKDGECQLGSYIAGTTIQIYVLWYYTI